jgi:peroxiredoxin
MFITPKEKMLPLKSWLVAATLFLSLAAQAQLKPGQKAPEISLPDATGKTVTLSSLAGKVVLIDFWASWCGPCRRANPKVVKLYNKYKDKGLVVLGVSLDEKKSDWLKAIATDKINYLQVLDAEGWQAKTPAAYGVEAIPATFLLNKKGMIVATDLEGQMLEKRIAELLE